MVFDQASAARAGNICEHGRCPTLSQPREMQSDRDGVRPPFILYGGNAERDQGNELRLRSAVPRSHAHKATAKIKQPMHWNGLLFGRMPKFERGRL
jgi:hypothetical protein